MKIIDFSALLREPRRRREAVVPHSPGTGLVIDFPTPPISNSDGRSLVLFKGDFVYQRDEKISRRARAAPRT